MLAGEWFDPRNEELTADRDRATLLMHRLNAECPGHDAAYRAALRELCPNAAGFIRAPFYCDYGYNIHIGEGSFVNFDCVFLDLAPIRIGRNTLIGPKVQLLTPHHPLDARPARDRPRSRQAHHHRRQLLAGRRRHRLSGRPDRQRRDNWSGFGSYARHSREFGCRRQSGPRHPHAFTHLTATPLCLPPALPIFNR